MKRLVCILLTVAALLSVCACTPAQQAEAPTLKNPSLGFSFSYPAGWSVVQNDAMIQICKEGASTVSLTAFELSLKEGQTAEDYLQDFKEHLNADLKDLKLENEKLLRETEAARWLSYVYTASYKEKSYRFMQSFAQKDSRLAVLTLCAPAEEFSEYNKLFEAVLDSFAFTEKTAAEQALPDGRVTNPSVEYSLLCPQGWRLTRNDGMIALQADDGSTFNTGAFTVDASVTSLDVYMNDHYFKDFSATVGAYTLIGDYEPLTVDGRYSALRCEYTAQLNGTDYHFDHLLVSRAGYIYSFLFTATQSRFSLHREEVNRIMESISFTKG